MQRIMVIGPCGSGKSTLASHLGKRLDLPVHHLDAIAWLPGWQEMDRAEYLKLQESLVAQDRWIIDGNHGSSMHLRLPRADTVIYLDFPISLCLWRLIKRIVKWHGRTRPDMGKGCPERLDLAFFWYVATWNIGPRKRSEKRLRGYEDKIIRLKSPKALAEWLASMEA